MSPAKWHVGLYRNFSPGEYKIERNKAPIQGPFSARETGKGRGVAETQWLKHLPYPKPVPLLGENTSPIGGFLENSI